MKAERSLDRKSAEPKERSSGRSSSVTEERSPRISVGAGRTGAPSDNEHTAEMCLGVEILRRVGDKWSLYVIHLLGTQGTSRFSELRRQIEGISQRMLTVTLRGLERDGLVHRTVYAEVPPRVEYELTPLGATLRGAVGELVVWSVEHLSEIDAARERYDQQEQR